MAIRNTMTQRVAPHLQPGENLQAVFAAQTRNQWWVLLFGIGLYLVNRFRLVAVTDRRILVFDCGKWSMTSIKSLVRELPRSTAIGEPSGLWWQTDTLGEHLYIHARFHKDVRQANAGRPLNAQHLTPQGYVQPIASAGFPPYVGHQPYAVPTYPSTAGYGAPSQMPPAHTQPYLPPGYHPPPAAPPVAPPQRGLYPDRSQPAYQPHQGQVGAGYPGTTAPGQFQPGAPPGYPPPGAGAPGQFQPPNAGPAGQNQQSNPYIRSSYPGPSVPPPPHFPDGTPPTRH